MSTCPQPFNTTVRLSPQQPPSSNQHDLVILLSLLCNRHFLVDKLEWRKVREQVAIHVPCSSKKMGIEESFAKLAGLCAHEVRRRRVSILRVKKRQDAQEDARE